MSILIPKTDAPPFEEPSPSWKPVKTVGGEIIALFTCPNGHTGTLKGWSITSDGEVTPSVNCISPMADGSECNFHDFIKLEDWSKD